MSSASDYLENAMLSHLFGKSGLLMPASFYLALATATIIDSHIGATLPEASYTGYQRILSVPADWTTPSGGNISNAAVIQFANNTGVSQIITDICTVMTGPARLTAGNIHLKNALGGPITVDNGENVRFEIGAINWSAA